MTPVALYSHDPARGWLPWAWLTPILMIVFNAVPVIALDGWMQSQHWSTPDPVAKDARSSELLAEFRQCGLTKV